ncbi:MAG: ATP-binding protein [Desulfuromonadaceae bacterium]|nr:ATP-binding protein [Desulfuromonadaceae bacterium]MDD5107659.1 ATP-binding protein [Desulfuromonadaceae bacterium]
MNNDITIEITMPATTCHLRLIGRISEILAEEIGNRDADRAALCELLSVVLTEGVVNVIKHACLSDLNNEIRIRISCSRGILIIMIYDNGIGFDLDAIPDPTFITPALTDKGRGIFILRSLMDMVSYRHANGSNVLEMTKKLDSEKITG